MISLRPRNFAAICLACGVAALAVSAKAQGVPSNPGILTPSQSHEQCPECHIGHNAGRETTLLKTGSPDALCLNCHGVAASGGGSAMGTPRFGVQPEAVASQHVWASQGRWGRLGKVRGGRAFAGACVQCHAPHRADWTGPGAAKTLRAEAFGSDGQKRAGPPGSAAELCFGCHGGGSTSDTMGARMGRVGILFSTSAVSRHTVGSRGKANAPSLRWGTRAEPMDCTSCHGGSPEAGLRGPHASRFPNLLSAQYETREGVPESELAYALCYGCHERRSILGNESFRLHREHITGHFTPLPEEVRSAQALARGGAPRGGASGARSAMPRALGQRSSAGASYQPASCSTCHDPHGSLENRALVRFDRFLVSENSKGQLSFSSLGVGRGVCSLACHGYDHVESSY